jgi:hypothetical protein
LWEIIGQKFGSLINSQGKKSVPFYVLSLHGAIVWDLISLLNKESLHVAVRPLPTADVTDPQFPSYI